MPREIKDIKGDTWQQHTSTVHGHKIRGTGVAASQVKASTRQPKQGGQAKRKEKGKESSFTTICFLRKESEIFLGSDRTYFAFFYSQLEK